MDGHRHHGGLAVAPSRGRKAQAPIDFTFGPDGSAAGVLARALREAGPPPCGMRIPRRTRAVYDAGRDRSFPTPDQFTSRKSQAAKKAGSAYRVGRAAGAVSKGSNLDFQNSPNSISFVKI